MALERKDDEVKIQVADTGIGMTPEESAKLFNEFVRIKNEDTYKILGSGLGLSTVRKLAQTVRRRRDRQEREGRRQHLHGDAARRGARDGRVLSPRGRPPVVAAPGDRRP